MKTNKWIGIGQVAAVAASIGLIAGAALADNEIVPYTPATGGTTNIPCPGIYYGNGKYTNSSGVWITAPTNITTGTFTDKSGFGAPYESDVYVYDKNTTVQWCGTNTVTFPATPGQKYSFTAYVKNVPPPPMTNQTLTLQVTWQ